ALVQFTFYLVIVYRIDGHKRHPERYKKYKQFFHSSLIFLETFTLLTRRRSLSSTVKSKSPISIFSLGRGIRPECSTTSPPMLSASPRTFSKLSSPMFITLTTSVRAVLP